MNRSKPIDPASVSKRDLVQSIHSMSRPLWGQMKSLAFTQEPGPDNVCEIYTATLAFGIINLANGTGNKKISAMLGKLRRKIPEEWSQERELFERNAEIISTLGTRFSDLPEEKREQPLCHGNPFEQSPEWLAWSGQCYDFLTRTEDSVREMCLESTYPNKQRKACLIAAVKMLKRMKPRSKLERMDRLYGLSMLAYHAE